MRHTFTAIIMLGCLLTILVTSGDQALASGIVLRPHGGIGHLKAEETKFSGLISHVGGRIVLSAAAGRKYGLEATYFHPTNGDDFVSLGIVLENKQWSWFNMSIGTIGFFHFLDTSDNPVGLTTNLGWEPERYKIFKPFITYRTDIIFHDRIAVMHSLSLGFSW